MGRFLPFNPISNDTFSLWPAPEYEGLSSASFGHSLNTIKQDTLPPIPFACALNCHLIFLAYVSDTDFALMQHFRNNLVK